MGLFNKLFNKSEGKKKEQTPHIANQPETETVKKILSQQKQNFDSLAAGKSPSERISEQTLLKIFSTYFAPNKEFYSVPGSDKYTAYFNAINTARDEMLRQHQLFYEATKWSSEELADLINNPKPGITNMMICSLIFLMGQYSVIKQAVYCVDFSERIPNCVALYLLLIAQKQPENNRTMLIDAGEGTNREPLIDAMNALRVCDSNWNYKIW